MTRIRTDPYARCGVWKLATERDKALVRTFQPPVEGPARQVRAGAFFLILVPLVVVVSPRKGLERLPNGRCLLNDCSRFMKPNFF